MIAKNTISNYDTPYTLKHRHFSLQGRINRIEFLFATLLCLGVIILFPLLFPKAADSFSEGLGVSSNSITSRVIYGVGVFTWCLFSIWSPLAITIKRMHDFNASGWRLLWGFVPYIVLITSLVFEGTILQALSVVARPAEASGFLNTWQMIFIMIHIFGPLFGFVFLLLKKGNNGNNRFGAPPPSFQATKLFRMG